MYSVHELKWPLTKLFESPCDKLVITLTRDAYGKYNSRALTRTQVIFPVIITWSCYNYHILYASILQLCVVEHPSPMPTGTLCYQYLSCEMTSVHCTCKSMYGHVCHTATHVNIQLAYLNTHNTLILEYTTFLNTTQFDIGMHNICIGNIFWDWNA